VGAGGTVLAGAGGTVLAGTAAGCGAGAAGSVFLQPSAKHKANGKAQTSGHWYMRRLPMIATFHVVFPAISIVAHQDKTMFGLVCPLQYLEPRLLQTAAVQR
jgi:hypothetical protein